MSKFNKQHQDAKLNTKTIGIGGAATPIFVAEHLSPENRSLHAATRLKAKALGFKFVWVRNGKIYVRKAESARPKLILNKHALDDLVA